MSFWELQADPAAVALVEPSGARHTYAGLQASVDEFAEQLPSGKTLGFVLSRNCVPTVVAYLAALQRRSAVCLLNADLDAELLGRLVERYSPHWLFAPGDVVRPLPNYSARATKDGRFLHKHMEAGIHPDLALLLPTSGTTGSPKLVRLSYTALQANAAAIAEYLAITPSERAITSLPLHYSYGLSVLNSHLQAGARTLLSDAPIVQAPFWALFRSEGATSLAGVPYVYETLRKLRFERMSLPSLRTLTQAGGRLANEHIEFFQATAMRNQQRFFVMYGQTEATARMSYVPPEVLANKIGSIGRPIPGGRFSLGDDGELIYEGPNVMMGYAESPADLAAGDTQGGRLFTGDLARPDQDGFFSLIGRKKRFLKLFGLRVNLEEVESELQSRFKVPVACYGSDDRLQIALEGWSAPEDVLQFLQERYQLNSSAIQVRGDVRLPRQASGKVDYPRLEEQSTHAGLP